MSPYLFKKHPISDLYEKYLGRADAAISFVTEAELLGWAEHKRWGEAKRRGSSDFCVGNRNA